MEPGRRATCESTKQLLAHAKEMVKIYGKRGRCDLLIAGDFNSSLEDSNFRRERTLKMMRGSGLKWAFQATPLAERITIPAEESYPDKCFEHVFYSPHMKLLSVTVPDGSSASDHNPVVVEVEP